MKLFKLSAPGWEKDFTTEDEFMAEFERLSKKFGIEQ